ncbi:EamA family transporter [Robiginitalea sp. M366]|uniref:DMT family transporter n=1 Tax=Robiginitalea aestuariiviva TaxID=3036903 RepID=UPI00240DA6C4|nr:EamA family transporter [Robiginitalea aestuariiviva]MDG1571718.1 EamA family transporter [Robiginitalea aestuariiviva]
MSDSNKRWAYLLVLALIWGSSYILIKKGLVGFTAFQLGSVRIVMAALMLLAIGFPSLKTIGRGQWKWVALSGVVGSLLPMYLFAFAETEIDSSIAAVLNSLVPLFTLFVGYFAFGIAFSRNQVAGVAVGLLGALALILLGADINPGQDYRFALLVVLASLGYACNANIIKSKLSGVSPMGIAAGNFICILPVAAVLLPFSGALGGAVTAGPEFWPSLGYIYLLCLFGTCVAKVMFNKLIQISTPVFSVSVTYLIPVVGIAWGLLDGERFSPMQVGAACTILLGVYLVNKTKRHPRRRAL